MPRIRLFKDLMLIKIILLLGPMNPNKANKRGLLGKESRASPHARQSTELIAGPAQPCASTLDVSGKTDVGSEGLKKLPYIPTPGLP